ncbi:MAG: HAMP domain-containing protein, partial [Fidelibacterota bacterium]
MTWLSKDPLAKLKIRYKLPLSFVMISLIAFGLGGYLIINTVHSSLFREIQTRLKSETIAQSSVFDQHLLMLGRRAQDFASDGFIRTQTELIAHSDSIDPDVQEGLINHLKINKLPIVEEFTNLHIFNTEGIRLISVNTPETAIENIVSFGFTQDTLWYSSLFSASDEGSSPLFAIVTPLINIRKTMPIGYLVCVVDFSRILTYISEHYQNALSFSDTEKYLTFLDQSGVFLNIPWWTLNRQENINLLDLSIQRTDLPVTAAIETHRNLHICTRGQEMFGYSFPLKYVDWTILVELSTSNALKTVKSLEERLFLVGLFIAVLILVAMYFPVRFLIRPLGELESMAFTIKEGDYSARVKTESEDEIGDLALSFNQMAEALEERTAVLDKTTKNLAKREKEIRIQHDRLTTVVNSMNDGLILLDSSGKIVLHNDAGKILSDYLLQSTKNIEKFECKNPDDAELPPCSHCLMDLNSMQGCTLKIDHRYIEVLSTRIPGLSGGTGKILVSRDITERTLIHEKHSRQERLAVLGNMAAVVAHEMNSPLAAISMYVQMMA